MKKILFSLSAASLMLSALLAQTAHAAMVIPPSDGGSIEISGMEIRHNVYTAGKEIKITGDILGDLHAAGGRVEVNGSIEEDAVIAGGDVFLNGAIGGDVRVAGGTIVIKGDVAGDVIVFAGEVDVAEESSVGGDIIAYGGTVSINGPVANNVTVKSGAVVINNLVGGEVKVSAKDGLTFGSRADIAKKISYKGPRNATVENGAKISSVQFEKVEHKEGAGKKLAGILTLTFIIKMLAIFAAAYLLARLFPRATQNTTDSMRAKPWVNLGIGVVTLIVIPIISLILLFTFIGYYIAFIAIFTYIVLLLLAGIAPVYYVGTWINKMLTKKQTPVRDWQSIALGVVALALVMLVPIIGGLLFFVLMLIALGAIIRSLKGLIETEQEQDKFPVEHN